MVVFPRAKINIGLRIIEKRTDGFHSIQTVFYPFGLADALEYVIEERETGNDRLIETGIPSGCKPKDNIVIKALKRIREIHNVPFLKIHLHKTIPPGAGLGGGSADATCLIRSLNRYFELGLSQASLKEIAASLGSDCPFFIDNVPSYGEGRGEILTPVDSLPDFYHIVVLKPEYEVSTADAYKNCTSWYDGRNLIDSYRTDTRLWKDTIFNDFEKSLFARYPEIADLKESLYSIGAVYSSMSGSGSAVFGLFEKLPDIPQSMMPVVVYSGKL